MEDQGQLVTLRGRQLVCAHCGGNHFARRNAQLNTAFLTFLGLDWLNTTAEVFMCTACGRLEWFLDPTAAPEDDTVECISCRATIPAGQDKCPQCGWTYKE
jgi:hypothetical protein